MTLQTPFAPSKLTPSGLLLALLGAACSGGGAPAPAQPSAPAGLDYTRNPAIHAQDVEIVPNAPVVKGQVDLWQVAPSLPNGLSLDPLSGVITGTPTEVSPALDYVVTAQNAHGKAQVTLRLSVVLPASFAITGDLDEDTLSMHVLEPVTGNLRPWSYSAAATGESWATQIVPFPGGSPIYVVNRNTDNVSVYDLDLSTGRLVARPAVFAGAMPFNMVLHPSGLAAYVTLLGGGFVQPFAIDPTTHDLTPLGAPVPTGVGPEGLAINAAGTFLYVGNSSSRTLRTFAIDPLTHELSVAGPDATTGKAPIAMAITADGRFLYLINARSMSLVTYALDPLSGLPGFVEERLVGLLPSSVAVDPGGRFLFVAISGENRVLSFAIDAASGGLTQVGAPATTGVQPSALRIDPTGRYLYTANTSSGDVSQFEIDASTGELASRGSSNTRGQPLGFVLVTGDAPAVPSPEFAYVSNRGSGSLSMFSADGTTGALTTLGPAAQAGSSPRGLASDPWSRFLYTVDSVADTLHSFSIDATTGELLQIAPPQTTGDDPRALAVDRSGRFLYVADFNGGTLSTFALDPSGGVPTPMSTLPVGLGPISVTIEPTGQFLYVANQGDATISTFRIDAATGALTSQGPDLPVGDLPRRLQPHPGGRFLFATFESLGRLEVYDLDTQSGLLSNGFSVASGTQPSSIAIDPLGRHAFTTNQDPGGVGDVSSFALGSLDAHPILLGTTLAGVNPIDAVLDPSGGFLYVANAGSDDVSLFAVDPQTAGLSLVGVYPTGLSPDSIVVAGTLTD